MNPKNIKTPGDINANLNDKDEKKSLENFTLENTLTFPPLFDKTTKTNL